MCKRIVIPHRKGTAHDAGPDLPIVLSFLRIDDLVLACTSAEPFGRIGLNIKHMSPYAHTLFVGHCNGYAGVLPTKEAFARGGADIGASPATEDEEWLFTQWMVESLRRMKSTGD